MEQTKGKLDADKARAIVEGLSQTDVNTLDFSDITDINFAALRVLLNARRSGLRFSILNASPVVAEKFEDTGVSAFISVCRKPKALNIGDYDEFGASFLSKSYYSKDGDSMIKVYGANVPKWVVAQEKNVAKAVLMFGINTPMVGTLYEDGEFTGLDFERIPGKHSFSRIISEQPERLEEMSTRFARMCKTLHSTPCDTSLFNDRTIYYRRAVVTCDELTESERQTMLAFIDIIPPSTTCLHGDMQISNVITQGDEDLWIDLSDFGYGNPMLDLGMWYFLSHLNPEQTTLNVFHLDNASMGRVWDCFAKEYFGADTPEKLEAVEKRVYPFAVLHMIYLGSTYGFMPHIPPLIHNYLSSD